MVSGKTRLVVCGMLMLWTLVWCAERQEATAGPVQTSLPPAAQALLDRARQANPTRYQFATDRGAKISATADGRGFLLSWFPATTGRNGRTMIVTLHGSSGWAFDEFFLWQDVAQRHGHGIIALQWWLANDAAPNDYYGRNSRTAISSDGGRSFVAEYDNPFNDLIVSMPGAGNTNVDPAVLKLAGGGYLAVTMRQKKLYLFVSGDGKIFLPLNGGVAIEAATFRSGATGFFDPTLVQLPDGRVLMYVTLEQGGQPEAIGRAELIPTRIVATTSAASFPDYGVAPESITALFGTGLAAGTNVATERPLPVSLGGVSVRIRDSSGVERVAPLFYTSPGQINYQVPTGSASGEAALTVVGGSSPAQGTILIQPTMPGIFTANADGTGVPAGSALRYRNNNLVGSEPLYVPDGLSGRYVPAPITLGEAGDQHYLVLFGTGWRNRPSTTSVRAVIGGVEAPVVDAGSQGFYVGLDQINILIPPELAGRGTVDLTVLVGSQSSNTVQVRIGK